MKILALMTLALAGTTAQPAPDSWQVYSRSQVNAFLVNVNSIVSDGTTSSVRVATVRRSNEAGDYTHSVETYEFRCAEGKWRTAGAVEYGPTGTEDGAFPEADAAWEGLRANTAPDYLKSIVCDGARIETAFADIKSYIDAGRP